LCVEFVIPRVKIVFVTGVFPFVVMSSPFKPKAKTNSPNYHSARRMKKYVAVLLAFAENAYRPSPTQVISCSEIPRVKEFH